METAGALTMCGYDAEPPKSFGLRGSGACGLLKMRQKTGAVRYSPGFPSSHTSKGVDYSTAINVLRNCTAPANISELLQIRIVPLSLCKRNWIPLRLSPTASNARNRLQHPPPDEHIIASLDLQKRLWRKRQAFLAQTTGREDGGTPRRRRIRF